MTLRNGFRFPLVLALAAGLAACAGSTGTVSQDGGAANALPVFVSWGVNGDGAGSAGWQTTPSAGDFQFRLHDRERNSSVSTAFVNRCYGHWNAEASSGGEDANLLAGTWRVHCTSGRIAEGRIVIDGEGGGRGEGFDREGRLVRLAFGPVPSTAKPSGSGQPE